LISVRTVLAIASFIIYVSAVVALHQERRAQYAVDVYGLAGAVSNLVYGAPVGTIYDGVLAPFLEGSRPVAQVLEESARGEVRTGALVKFAPDGNGIGYVAVTTLAMRLFGLNLSSMTFLLLGFMAASTLAFLWRYRDERAFAVPLYFFSVTIMLFTWLVYDRNIANQIPIGGMRYYSVVAVLPAMHVLLEVADTSRPAAIARVRNLALLAVQLFLLAAVVFIRPSAAYLPMAIVAGALLVIAAHRRNRAALRTIMGKGAYLAALTGLLVGLTILWMPKDYLEAGRATPAFWHRLVLSLGAGPAWPYDNIRDVYRCNEKWAIPDLVPGIVDQNAECLWASYAAAHGISMRDFPEQYLGGRYETAMREAFFNFARLNPARVLETFLYYKPWMTLSMIEEGMKIDLARQPTLMISLLLAQAANLVCIAFISPSPGKRTKILGSITILFLIFSLLPVFVAWATAHTSVDLLLYLFFGLGLILSTALGFALKTAMEGLSAGRTFEIVLFRSLALNLLLTGGLVLPWLAAEWFEPRPGPEVILERLTKRLYGADAHVMGAALQADRGKLASPFEALQQARREVRQKLAAQPLDPETLAKAMSDLRVKADAFAAALQDIMLQAARKLSPDGRNHLRLDPGMEL
jgi:hypothetical protein